MNYAGQRQSSNVYVQPTAPNTAATNASSAQSTKAGSPALTGTASRQMQQQYNSQDNDYPNGPRDGGDAAVQAGINSIAAAAQHDAQATGTYQRIQTLPPGGPLNVPGRTRWPKGDDKANR